MPKTLQVRNVLEGLHRTLKERAARAGMSLSAYLLKEHQRFVQRPTSEESRCRLEGRRSAQLSVRPGEAGAEERVRR